MVLIQLDDRRKPQRRWPVATVALVVAGVAIMLWQGQMQPEERRALFAMAGVQPISSTPSIWSWTLLTALFVHADWVHASGNFLFSLLFGIPVERRLGSWGFLLVYFASGVAANLAGMPDTGVALVGASGAVSGLIAAYVVLFPRADVGILLPLGLFVEFLKVPAYLLMGSWFALQVVYTVFDVGIGTVAWQSHAMGFVIGLASAYMLAPLTRRR